MWQFTEVEIKVPNISRRVFCIVRRNECTSNKVEKIYARTTCIRPTIKLRCGKNMPVRVYDRQYSFI